MFFYLAKKKDMNLECLLYCFWFVIPRKEKGPYLE